MDLPLIYLDHNATAPLREVAREAMAPFLEGPRGNPSSLHRLGREAARAVEEARAEIATLLGAEDPGTIVFTSGATESDVWALRGAFDEGGGQGRGALVVGTTEHPAVLDTARALEQRGVPVRRVGVDERGRLLPFELEGEVRLVSLMAANNESGARHDVTSLAAQARRHGALFHTDAVQLLGRSPVEVRAWGVDLCSISSHKIGGPMGVGALYLRPGLSYPALITGGGHERGRRSGTLNVPGIVGFGAAARAVREGLARSVARQAKLRDHFEQVLAAEVSGVRFLGDHERRLPNTSLFSVPGVKGEAVVIELDAQGVALSTGAACSSGSGKPSHVLVAMGAPSEVIAGALRVSVGESTQLAEIDAAVALLSASIARLRALT